jgi:hypothetical protein
MSTPEKPIHIHSEPIPPESAGGRKPDFVNQTFTDGSSRRIFAADVSRARICTLETEYLNVLHVIYLTQTNLLGMSPERADEIFAGKIEDFEKLSPEKRKSQITEEKGAVSQQLLATHQKKLDLVCDILTDVGQFCTTDDLQGRLSEIDARKKAFGKAPFGKRLELAVTAKMEADYLLLNNFETFLIRWENRMRELHKPEEVITNAITTKHGEFDTAFPKGKVGISTTLRQQLHDYYEEMVITLIEEVTDSNTQKRFFGQYNGASFEQKERLIRRIKATIKKRSA